MARFRNPISRTGCLPATDLVFEGSLEINQGFRCVDVWCSIGTYSCFEVDMIVAVVREVLDSRSALIPEAVKKLMEIQGIKVNIEADLSKHWTNEEYQAAGAQLVRNREDLLGGADVILRINSSDAREIAYARRGSLHVSLLDPYNKRELVEAYAKAGVDALSLEMIPRTTLAQKMDVLSSQASLAGYVAVIKAAERLARIFPMMMTPAGTITPAKVFVIGAGVAGLQAIATAKRLGARVEAFDTRPVVEEQVQSLGAKFLRVDLGETGQTKDGYAKALSPEQIAKQQEAMARAVASSDVTITTAKLFGRKAPILITSKMLKMLRPGSIIVDLAAGSGGNVEGVEIDKEIVVNGVRIIGIDNMPGEVAVHASQMFASNMVNLLRHIYDTDRGILKLDKDSGADEIALGCVIVRGGAVVHEGIKAHYKGE